MPPLKLTKAVAEQTQVSETKTDAVEVAPTHKKPRKSKAKQVAVEVPDAKEVLTNTEGGSTQKVKKQKKMKDPNRKVNDWSVFISQEYHKVKKEMPQLADSKIMSELSSRYAPLKASKAKKETAKSSK